LAARSSVECGPPLKPQYESLLASLSAPGEARALRNERARAASMTQLGQGGPNGALRSWQPAHDVSQSHHGASLSTVLRSAGVHVYGDGDAHPADFSHRDHAQMRPPSARRPPASAFAADRAPPPPFARYGSTAWRGQNEAHTLHSYDAAPCAHKDAPRARSQHHTPRQRSPHAGCSSRSPRAGGRRVAVEDGAGGSVPSALQRMQQLQAALEEKLGSVERFARRGTS